MTDGEDAETPREGATLTEELPAALDQERIDRFVCLLTNLSRRQAADLISAGQVLIDGRVIDKPSLRLTAGQHVVVHLPPDPQPLAGDPSVIVPVVYEDDQVLVVDKPAGMVVHPGSGVDSGTMVQGLLAAYPDIAGVGNDPDRPGVVHRLDRGTSGLLMVARTDPAFDELSQQLMDRTVLRQYLTLVWGRLASLEGVVDAPIGRSARQATKQAVVADGRDARTRYEVLERFDDPETTLLGCRLETGRTHQIRVHLEAIGHPVVADPRYGKPKDPLRSELGRPFLHAAVLGFDHPSTGELMSFESPLPAKLSELLDALVRSDGDASEL